MKKILFFFLTVILSLAGTAGADFYTWEDEAGVSQHHGLSAPEKSKDREDENVRRNHVRKAG
jgi:hypothetical protein